MDRSDDDWPSVLHIIRKSRQVWGGDLGDTLEVVGGDGSLGTILLRGNSVSNLVQSGDIGDHRDNYSEIIESACEFLESGHT